ncbi:hypothetical protein Pcinc_043221 [Petrolisthes cinctipes]|uniref:Uncharacterized protein n=1 Tax=Petrolisthes cinctipes TaxID=88211 RepID=A0AAE1EGF3_PETCI|nr:hypothetical protein Pcinc_043221 [Petrolisthes cinctipes]
MRVKIETTEEKIVEDKDEDVRVEENGSNLVKQGKETSKHTNERRGRERGQRRKKGRQGEEIRREEDKVRRTVKGSAKYKDRFSTAPFTSSSIRL